jgi:hypothetical protein
MAEGWRAVCGDVRNVESGTLCRGDGGHAWGARPRRALIAYPLTLR